MSINNNNNNNPIQIENYIIERNIGVGAFGKVKRIKNLKKLVIDIVESKLNMPFVWKCTEFGYDGNGVKIIRTLQDLDNLPNVECIAEKMVEFKNELAVIVCRNPSGEIKTYPVVEMEFHPEANQVEYVICPARIDSTVAQKATEIALKVSEAFNHIGLLAVEMFQTDDDKIRHDCQVIKYSSHSLLSSVNDILDFSMVVSG